MVLNFRRPSAFLAACALTAAGLSGCTVKPGDMSSTPAAGPIVPVLPAPPPPWPEPNWLIGLAFDEVIERLGRPERDVVSGDVRLLDYLRFECNLSVFLRGGDRSWRVSHVLAFDAKTKAYPSGQCAERLLKRVNER